MSKKKKNKKRKKFSPNNTGIPVATSYHYYSLDQVIEWSMTSIEPEQREKKKNKALKEIKKLEDKGKYVIYID